MQRTPDPSAPPDPRAAAPCTAFDATPEAVRQLLAHTEELAHIGSAQIDLESGQAQLSAGLYKLLGVPAEPAGVSAEWFYERVPEGERDFVRSIVEGVCPGDPCEFQHRIVHADGSLRVVLQRSLAEADASGRRVRVVLILQDITAQRAAEQQASHLANYDEVTGLPNRTLLVSELEDALRQSRREDRPLGLLLMELDQLKLVTDTLGYAGGDSLLLTLAQRLGAAVRPGDLLAHLGSGEYAVLLRHESAPDADTAVRAAQHILHSLREPVLLGDHEVGLTCSVGLALYPQHAYSAETLLHCAQAARLQARGNGEARIGVYSSEMHATAARQLALAAALRRALERSEFQLHYQPQVDLVSGQMCGMEALLRWPDGAGGWNSPAEFIPVAEEAGLILALGEWVLRSACEQSVAWQRQGLRTPRVAVNLSVRQLQQPDFARRVQSILLETQMDPRQLGLEITESLLMDESAHVVRTLGELKAMGIEISLDDFGTGYSNLGYLRRLPIDVVKVDRSFVPDVTAAPEEVSMTRAVITMAHSLQKKVLAEGVETEGQLALLVANRCDQIQGYFFSRPLPPEALAELLREGRRLPEHLLARKRRERTLLLVDDEENIVSSLKRLLRRDGYNVVTANSGAQGLQRLAEHEVDVILSDQRMPGMTGVEFLRRAKELYPDTVRMSLSGYTELQSITDAINEGAIYKFLTKPWDDERLRGHIAEAFRYKEMVDENQRLDNEARVANQELVQVNELLKHLVNAQREARSHEQASQIVAREMLEQIPVPVIGVDLSGMVAYANEPAEHLLAGEVPLVGSPAAEVLPPGLQEAWRDEDPAATHLLELTGQRFQVMCREMGAPARSRGRLLVLASLPH